MIAYAVRTRSAVFVEMSRTSFGSTQRRQADTKGAKRELSAALLDLYSGFTLPKSFCAIRQWRETPAAVRDEHCEQAGNQWDDRGRETITDYREQQSPRA